MTTARSVVIAFAISGHLDARIPDPVVRFRARLASAGRGADCKSSSAHNGHTPTWGATRISVSRSGAACERYGIA